MNTRRPIAATFTVACVSISSSLLAQSTIPKCASVAWDNSVGASGSITRTVTGEFIRTYTNDRAPDVVLLKGGRVCILPSVDTFGAQFEIANFQVNDVAAPPPATSGTAVSSVYTVGAAGLQRVDFTIQSGLPFATKTTLASGAFVNAKRLVVGHLNSDAYLDFVAADASNDLVVVWLGNASNSNPITTFDPSATGSIADLAIGHYTGSASAREIAVQTTTSLSLHSAGGSAIRTIPAYYGAGLVATEVNTRTGRDRVIWLTPFSGPHYALCVVGDTGAGDDPPVVLGPIGARALSAGDMDRDGDSEALFVSDSMPQTCVFDNLRSSANPSVASYSLYSGFRLADPGMGTALTNNVAQPMVVDIDGDTDGDVLHIAQNDSDRKVQAFRNTTSGELSIPSFQPSSSGTVDHEINPAGLFVTEHCTFPTSSGCDTLEIAIYHQDTASTTAPIVPTSTFQIPATSANVDITLLLDESNLSFLDVYNVVVRRVPTGGTVSDLTNRPHLTWGVVGTSASATIFKDNEFLSNWLSFVNPLPGGDTGGSGSRPNIIPATGSGGSYPP